LALSVQRVASERLNSFVTSARFRRMVDATFEQCDLDGSGTIDAGELFSALLLLNHSLNKLPLGSRQHPPSRARVLEYLRTHAVSEHAALSRQDFLAVAQDVCKCVAGSALRSACGIEPRIRTGAYLPYLAVRRREVATGVPRNMFITFVLCPLLSTYAKTGLLRALGGLHPHCGACVAACSLHARMRTLRACYCARTARRGVLAADASLCALR
jgi:hypothetical protein